MKMKKIKIVLHVLLFCILVCVGTAYLENIFENKSTEAASKVYQDYGKNQFDVIFLEDKTK